MTQIRGGWCDCEFSEFWGWWAASPISNQTVRLVPSPDTDQSVARASNDGQAAATLVAMSSAVLPRSALVLDLDPQARRAQARADDNAALGRRELL